VRRSDLPLEGLARSLQDFARVVLVAGGLFAKEQTVEHRTVEGAGGVQLLQRGEGFLVRALVVEADGVFFDGREIVGAASGEADRGEREQKRDEPHGRPPIHFSQEKACRV
jgi:hypothetical protein